MKYCLPFLINSQYKDTIDELYIQVYETSDILKLPAFLEQHQKQRVIIVIEDFEIITKDKFKMIASKMTTNNFTICMGNGIDFFLKRDFASYCSGYNFPFCFERGIGDWDSLRGVLDMGVSDVYIVEALGFELDKVADVVHAFGAQVRCYPNVAQSSWNGANPLYSFWIRPEDVRFYEGYIDVLESYDKSKDSVKSDVFYDIYGKDQFWCGDLNELIGGLKSANVSLDSRRIVEPWARSRIKCGKKCLKGNGCRICHYVLTLAETLKNDDLTLSPTEKKDD